MSTQPGLNWEFIFLRLEKHKLAPTELRIAVLRKLNKEQQPVSASGLAQLFGATKSDQVKTYRALKDLVKAGLVKRVRFLSEDEDRFELGEALHPHHHHVVCESCGVTRGVKAEPARPKVPRGFKLLGHQLEFYGVCAQCQKGTA